MGNTLFRNMRPDSNNREKLLAVGDYSSAQKSLISSTAKQVRHYIGTIEIPGIARGTACLLEDGRILTCLHNILDYDKLTSQRAELIDFDAHDVSVSFVKDDNIYSYKINSSPINGLNNLKTYGAKAWCFDYAFLETEGNPVRDLGGGFKLDQTNHFGLAFASDPAQTLAISGPFVTRTEEGEIKFHRYVSLSENQAAQSQYYHIPQTGNHPSAPGFSGMGMIPIDRSYSIDTLYAIHSYRDNQNQQSGAKISEILSSMRDNVPDTNVTLDPFVIHTLQNWYERLTTATINRDGSVTRGRTVTIAEAVQILGNRVGDIAADNASEAKEVAEKWSGSDGKPIHHGIHVNAPKGQPHYHHAFHDADSYNYPGHIFHPTEAAQQASNKAAQEAGWKAKVEAAKLKREAKEKEAQAKKNSSTTKPESMVEEIRKKQEDKDSDKSGGRV